MALKGMDEDKPRVLQYTGLKSLEVLSVEIHSVEKALIIHSVDKN